MRGQHDPSQGNVRGIISLDRPSGERARGALSSGKRAWLRLATDLHQFYLVLLLHVVIAGIMVLSSALGIEPWWVTWTTTLVFAVTDAVFYKLLQHEHNERRRDPTMMVPRLLVMVITMLLVQVYAGPTKGACALTLITTFVIAGAQADLRTMLRLSLLTIIAYAATLPLMHVVEGAAFNRNAEYVNWISFSSALLAAVLAGDTISHLRRRLAESNRRLSESLDLATALATTDELTAVRNRRYLVEMMDYEVRRASRGGAGFSVCLFDIDHFKRINDSYGHHCGDAVLKAFARLVDDGKRAGDIFGRWGGEEFLLFLPQSQLSTARHLAERIRTAFAELKIPELPEGTSISVSGGIAEIQPQEAPSALIERADQALYRAKQNGRDRVESTPSEVLDRGADGLRRVAF